LFLFNFFAFAQSHYLGIDQAITHSHPLHSFYFPYYNQTISLIDLVLNDPQRQTSPQCDTSLQHLRNGLDNFDEWALKFYEANGKPKNGKLFGYNGDLGDYDQCLSIRTGSDMASQFSGQYCLVSVQTAESEQIKQTDLYKKNANGLSESSKFITDFSLGTVQGTCVPSTCNINDIVYSINRVSKSIKLIPQKHCSIADQVESFSIMEMVAFAVFGLFTLLCILSTMFPMRFWDYFHLGDNFAKLCHINEKPEATTTNHLHGTKVAYMFVGIIGHCWGMLMPFAPFLYGGMKSLAFDAVSRSFLDRILIGPDMMFFISGFLSMYTWYNPMRKYKIGFSKYVLIRFLRCLTVVGIAILGGYIWPRFGSGPYFNELAQHFHKSCTENGWKNLLLINNQDRMLDICALPTWFLSSDFQLYVQSYFTTYYFAIAPKIGFLIAALQMLINSAYTVYDAYVNDYPKYMTCTNVTALHSIEVEQQYFYTYLHSNVYTLGIICGWLVVSKKEINLSKLSTALVWIGSLTATLSAFYLPDLWHYGFIEVNDYFLYVWPVLTRILFITVIFWATYSTSFNYNLTFKRIMSCRFMITMSRMSMSMVTCQFFYLWYYLGTRRDLIRLTIFDLMREGILAFFLCWFIGFLMYLFIEAPCVNLLYTMFGLRRRVELTEKLEETETDKLETSKEEKIMKEDSMLDENANVKEECQCAYLAAKSNSKCKDNLFN